MIDDFFRAGEFKAKAVRRSILEYTRRPIEYNFDQLPPVEHYCDMELAFREDFFDPPRLSIRHALSYPKCILLFLLFLIGYIVLDLIPLLIVAGFVIYSFPGIFIRRSATYRHVLKVQATLAILAVLVAGLVYVITDALPYTALGVVAIGLPTVYCVRRFSDDFYGFVLTWMHTHPCLSNADRQESLRSARFPNQSLGLPTLIIGALALGSMFSFLWTQVVVYAILLTCLVNGPVARACRKTTGITWRSFGTAMSEFFAEYLSYGERFPYPLPGLWLSPSTPVDRRRFILLSLLLTVITFASGTGFFFAWNTPGFRGEYSDMFFATYYTDPKVWNALNKDIPNFDWNSVPDRDRLKSMKSRLDSLLFIRHRAIDKEKAAIDDEIEQLRNTLSNAPNALESLMVTWYQHSSKSWIEVASHSALKHPKTVGASLLLLLFNALLVPALFIFATLQERLLLLALQREILAARIATETTRTPWEWFVDRLRNSQHTAPQPNHAESEIREADHLFLGLEAENGFPMLLHQDILVEHAYISGGSGSGKTSLGILSMLVQLIRAKTPDAANSEGGMPPIVIIDLKGEHALLHTVREEVRKQAEREGRTLEDCFRLFTSEKGMATHYFNPLGDMTYPDRYLADLANLLLDALELNHGSGYGRSFYSRKNYMLLHEALKTDGPATFDDLCNRVIKAMQRNQEDRHQGFELLATLYGLTEFAQLKPPSDVPESDMISMRQVIEKRQVVYFWLPTVESSILAREIANLALFSYFSAMRDRSKTRKPQRRSYLVIDEFQRLAGDRFGVILQQARGFGLSAILSNQSISDLKTPAFDLRPVVSQNTRIKLYFSFADYREMSDFAYRSGEELSYLRSGEYDIAADTQPDAPLYNQWKHTIKPRVTTNDMLRVTDHPLQAFMDVRSGAGYTQFCGKTLPVQMFHPVRWSDFQKRRDTMPWPSSEELGFRSSMLSEVSSKEVDDRVASMFAELDLRVQRLDEENPELRFS